MVVCMARFECEWPSLSENVSTIPVIFNHWCLEDNFLESDVLEISVFLDELRLSDIEIRLYVFSKHA